jgi:lysine 2,3-aminomutase
MGTEEEHKETLLLDQETRPGIEEWVNQDRHSIHFADELKGKIDFTDEEYDRISRACDKFQMKITPYYLGLIDQDDPNDPIRKMALPDCRELDVLDVELEDPIGDINPDLNNQPVPSLTHRYPDRVLLYPTPLCGLYCRHCFRRRYAGKTESAADNAELQKAIDYIAGHEQIQEVILTGGDPLMLSDNRLFSILRRIKEISHVRTIRIHSRMPVVNPYRITEELAEGLKEFQPLWIVTHFNHPNEVSEIAKKHIARLVDRGIPMLNQAVLLKGVNDNADTLRELGWSLVEARVKPYYLHHLDQAEGVSHFRVSLKKGLKLLKALRGTMPGYAIPTYILDIPKGYGKVPLQYHHLSIDEDDRIYVESPEGDYHLYADVSEEEPVLPDELPEIKPLEAYPAEDVLNERLQKLMEQND